MKCQPCVSANSSELL